ncbi:MAG: 50S ribosomal protein L32 [Nitrospirota bacterium]
MPNPKHKHSKARTRSRRTHEKLAPPTVVTCSQCNEPKRPHYACLSCGYYDGREVIEIKVKAAS